MQPTTALDPPPTFAPLAPTEVHHLAWLLDSAVLHADTRIQLRRSWGLCPRHTWALALVEAELRGGVVLTTTAVYADLAAGAAYAALHDVRGLLSATQPRRCLTCTARGGGHDAWRERAARLNRPTRFLALLNESWDEALARACPRCVGGRGPLCRPHLLGGFPASDDLSTRLRRLAVQIRALAAGGERADPRLRAAWVETLGWFAGWRLPIALRAITAPAAARRPQPPTAPSTTPRR